jgi:site-specific recombinase XerC
MPNPSASSTLVLFDPDFTNPERLALAGFLAGYTGLTRDAYGLDLRQFVAWCDQQQIRLFDIRRSDIERFARTLEERGRARATVARRLCTVTGFYRYAVEEGAAGSFTSGPRPPTPPRLRVSRHRTGPQ